jgi:catechol 2,3-dioxygenase-like lactoylglutathione lyase family enzyme
LYHIPSDSEVSYTSGNDYAKAPTGIGFGHIGFTVPDVGKALERVRSFGYEVIKPLGEVEDKQMGVPMKAMEGTEVVEGYKHVFRQLAFVRDPDVSVMRVFGQLCVKVLMCCVGVLGGARSPGCAVIVGRLETNDEIQRCGRYCLRC